MGREKQRRKKEKKRQEKQARVKARQNRRIQAWKRRVDAEREVRQQIERLKPWYLRPAVTIPAISAALIIPGFINPDAALYSLHFIMITIAIASVLYTLWALGLFDFGENQDERH
ncbi:MAG: hypothetical protein P1V97_18070 [Planctomycetota bacterium]|nr:hypothetical protein [Planctomycetota bacterium]